MVYIIKVTSVAAIDKLYTPHNIKVLRHLKLDSVILRLPVNLTKAYAIDLIKGGGCAFIATNEVNKIRGILYYTPDNNIGLNFVKHHKYSIGLSLIRSFRISDLQILWTLTISALKMGLRDLDAEFENEISLVAVNPDVRGQGIGTKLISACLSTIETRPIRIKTDLENRSAERLYSRLGFVAYKHIQFGTRRLICMKCEH